MADPLSVTVSIVPIVTAALSSAKAISNTINNIKDGPRLVRELGKSIESLERILKSIHANADGLILREHIIATAIESNNTCLEIKGVLIRWSEHPSWVIGVLKDDQLAAYKKQVNGLRDEMQFVLHASHSIQSVKQGAEQIKKLVEITESVERLRAYFAQKGATLRNPKLLTDKNNVDVTIKSLRDVMQKIEAGTDQNSTAEAHQKISGVTTEDHSIAFVGSFGIGPDQVPKRQELSAITTKGSSFTVVGTWAGNVDLAGLAPLRSVRKA